ncbi:MAG TPA: ceramidase domain-containing protein [Steroidobacteraceae bacterium]|nr:ceramidase domain-containing protein [Steroidobacteraceae bacterium]
MTVGLFLLDPIPQDPRYHDFADGRTLLGIPNFWNVVTNAPFLVIGALGFALSGRVAAPDLGFHYRFLCVAVALIAAGSAWYHLAPSTPTLVWDRLPMTAAFMALFAALIADRISWFAGRALLWPLVVAGLASIAWWVRTEAAGAGDLRPYALVQFLPMLLMPMILLMWPKGGLASSWLWAGFGAYAAAKVAEHFDAAIFAATGVTGGHAIKHLLAALAAACLVRAFHGAPARAL